MASHLDAISHLSPSQLAALSARLRARHVDANPDVITPRDRRQPCPLSFAQERLWFLDRLVPGSAFYNVPTALRLEGALDVVALERALGEIVRRHEALRTAFAEVEGAPIQVITPFHGFRLPVENLSARTVAEREAEVRRLAQEQGLRPFDLASGRLARAMLLRLREQEHFLLICLHHIVSDGWSMGVLCRELSVLYAAYRQGRHSPLPELAVQYADYAVWQRAHLQGEALQRQLAYWRARLLGMSVLLPLPTDRARPAVQSDRGASSEVEVPWLLLERLRELARREGDTLYMVLLAAFQVLLAKYSGSADVVVGTPIAGRTRQELEGLIGFFVNTLVLRTDLSGDPSFVQVLRRVREVTLGAFDHQDVPFEKLVGELQPERSLSHSPLFQVVFVLQDAERPRPGLAGLTVHDVEIETDSTKFDLALTLTETSRGLVIGMTYSTTLFEASTIRRLGGHLVRVLEQVTADPDVRLSALQLMAVAEWAQVLDEWNKTEAAYPPERCVDELFEAQAINTPTAVALACDDETLTYHELNARANQLARHLRRLGVGPETRVVIYTERGLNLVVAMVAVLKAGGAYVPLDSSAPAERVAFMLADASAALVVTQERLRHRLAARARVTVVSVDAAAEEIAEECRDNLGRFTGPRSLAYVIYTSGSTGTPKGVAVEHGSLCTLCRWHARAFAVTGADRATQLASPGFDAMAWEVWPYLLRGACVDVVPEAVRVDPYALRDWLVRHAITVTFVPTPVAEPLTTLEWPRRTALRWLLTGGDRLKAHPDTPLPFALCNNYGPTECTVVATSGVVEPRSASTPSIGKPISNTRVYVLGDGLCPLPANVPGELYIGGGGVARGYLDRPALTAERFVPDPFGSTPGGRLYRTGDRVRWCAEGTLEFVGRVDAQVKVRGFRIEPGEIESVLREHDHVRDCAVVAREDVPGVTRLVAYVVGAGDMKALQAHLQQRLPDYMVPAAFVALDTLPLTANGKVDRKALPPPDYGQAAGYVAPRTPMEETLTQIWRDVLRIERVGIRDNWFGLGGDSILSIQIVTRAARAGIRLTVRDVFERQTIEQLAQVAATGKAHDDQPDVPQGPSPLTPIQEWFFAQHLRNPHHFNQALVLDVRAPWPYQAVLEAAAHVIDAHPVFTSRFEHQDGAWRQVFDGAARRDAMGIVDFSGLEARDRDRAWRDMADALQRSLHLKRGPLIRVRLAIIRHLEPPKLFVVVHHLVIDGVSWRILIDDLQTVCHQMTTGQGVRLPVCRTSYQRWAESLERLASAPQLEAEQSYWNEQVAGVKRLTPDTVNPQNTLDASGRVSLFLSAAETQALLAGARDDERDRVAAKLLAALVWSISRHWSVDAVAIDIERHGREESLVGRDVSRTVGWFTAVFPLLLPVVRADLRQQLRLVSVALSRVPNGGIGFGLLRRRQIVPPSRASIAFNYLGRFDPLFTDDSVFSPGPDPIGESRDGRGARTHMFDCVATIVDARLRLEWLYSPAQFAHETVNALADAWREALGRLLDEEAGSPAEGFEYADSSLSADEIAAIKTRLAAAGASCP